MCVIVGVFYIRRRKKCASYVFFRYSFNFVFMNFGMMMIGCFGVRFCLWSLMFGLCL